MDPGPGSRSEDAEDCRERRFVAAFSPSVGPSFLSRFFVVPFSPRPFATFSEDLTATVDDMMKVVVCNNWKFVKN